MFAALFALLVYWANPASLLGLPGSGWIGLALAGALFWAVSAGWRWARAAIVAAGIASVVMLLSIQFDGVFAFESYRPINWLSRPTRLAVLLARLRLLLEPHGLLHADLLAGLQAIPKDLYEAAKMDATSPARAFWRITLPLVMPDADGGDRPELIRSFQVFDEVYLLTGGGPGRETFMVVQNIYETGFQSQVPDYGAAAAGSVLMAVVIAVSPSPSSGSRGGSRGSEMAGVIPFLTRTRGTRGPGRALRPAGFPRLCLPRLRGCSSSSCQCSGTVLASIKSERSVNNFDTRLLPFVQMNVDVPGSGSRKAGSTPPRRDPDRGVQGRAHPCDDGRGPGERPRGRLRRARESLTPNETIRIATENYLDPILARNGQDNFFFGRYLFNSVFVTVMATLITLVINAMAAFALSKYQFRGRLTFTILIVATLLIPSSIILVSLFFVVWSFGIFGSLWGVIIPAPRRRRACSSCASTC